MKGKIVWIVFDEFGEVSGVFDTEEKAITYCKEHPNGTTPYEKWEVE